MGIVAALIAVASIVVLFKGNDTSDADLMQNCLRAQEYRVQATDGTSKKVAFDSLTVEQQARFRSLGMDPQTHCQARLDSRDRS